MSCVEDMCYVKESLLSKLKEHCCDPMADAKELGEVADIIKDMCEAEYYCKVNEAMEKKVKDPYVDIYGYPFVEPVRDGNIYGYRPFMDQEPYIRDYLGMTPNTTVGERMGYNPPHMEHDMYKEQIPQYGKAYMEYERSRKHYTMTKDETDKKEMNKHMDEHVRDTISTIRQMWTDADPAQRTHLKMDIQTLLDGMKE